MTAGRGEVSCWASAEQLQQVHILLLVHANHVLVGFLECDGDGIEAIDNGDELKARVIPPTPTQETACNNTYPFTLHIIFCGFCGPCFIFFSSINWHIYF